MSLLKKGGYTSYVSSRPENDPAAEIQNVSSSRVYIFGNDEADEMGIEDSTLEMTELRPRNKNKRSYASTKSGPRQSRKTETIDREVLPTDSLQSVSLQYGCTVRKLMYCYNNVIRIIVYIACMCLSLQLSKIEEWD